MTAPWDPQASHMRVVLRNVVTQARVGLHPWEQYAERPTRLVVNVEMFAPVASDAPAATADDIIDYDPVRAALLAWPSRPHTPLLETLLDELVGLCFRNRRVAACRVSVMKPDIFNEAEAAGVELFIRRADYRGAHA